MEFKDYLIVSIIVVVALVAGVLSAYQYIESNMKDKKDDANAKKLAKSQEDLLNANEKISLSQAIALKASERLNDAQLETIEKANDLIEAQNKIDRLQGEVIKQVLGDGYPALLFTDSQGSEFEIFIKSSSSYPIFDLRLRIIDGEKLKNCKFTESEHSITMDRSCFNTCILFDPLKGLDLQGGRMHFIDYKLQKKDYYIVTEFMSKHLTCIQYSIISYSGNILIHSYRLYKISDDGLHIEKILYSSNSDILESQYKEHFFMDKVLIVDYSK